MSGRRWRRRQQGEGQEGGEKGKEKELPAKVARALASATNQPTKMGVCMYERRATGRCKKGWNM